MCQECIKKTKNKGFKGKTYGQIKALAHSFMRHRIMAISRLPGVYIAVEAHLEKIYRAQTNNRIYKRHKNGFH